MASATPQQRRTALLVLAAMLAAVAVLVTSSGEEGGHRISAVVPEATNLIAGQEVRAGGAVIGEIDDVEPVDRGRRARIVLRISDDAWPLPRDSRFSVRWGGTASFYNRHVLVSRGTEGGPALAEGEEIAASRFLVPVEVDQLLASFDGPVRTDLKSMINRSGLALDTARADLERTLDRAPAAITPAADLIGDLTADRGALRTTVRRTDRVVEAVRRADPGLSTLLDGAARTFSAIADRSTELGQTLRAMPATLGQVRTTLERADGTLADVGRLARDLGPGVRELRAIARPVDRTLGAVDDLAPSARATLRTVRRDGDELNALLTRLVTLSPQLGRTGDRAVENLECIRPYTPEIVALLMTWGDFMSWDDGNDKILRAQVQDFLPAQYNSVPLKPAQAAELYPGLRYGFPRPPGYNAGQPWFQPRCGAGEDALDPSKDREASLPANVPPEGRR